MLSTHEYLLAGAPLELERLRVQALAWEPETETMLDEIGVADGWRCVDVGCGPVGIIGPLTKRGASVVALDQDPVQINAARQYAGTLPQARVEFHEGDLFNTGLPDGHFDLVHARFLLAPVGRHSEVLRRLASLARDGGFVAFQEPDAATWSCAPACPSWDLLKRLVVEAFRFAGGEFSAGARVGRLMRDSGLQPIAVREAVLNLPGTHPYSKLLIDLARSLAPAILARGCIDSGALQNAVTACEEALRQPDCSVQTFRLVQAWGQTRLR